MKQGSFESKKWILDYYYPRTILPFFKGIYNFIIYRRITKTCTYDEIFKLNALIKIKDMEQAIKIVIGDIRKQLIDDNAEKQRQIDNLSYTNSLDIRYEQRIFDEEMEEIKYENGLTTEQLKLRNENYYFNKGNIYTIPQGILKSQKIIDQSTYKNIIQYKIHDKIYKCWSATIIAPGTNIFIRDIKLASLKRTIKVKLEELYNNYLQNQKIIVQQQIKQNEQHRRQRQRIENDINNQVQNIRNILGQDNTDNDVPNIF